MKHCLPACFFPSIAKRFLTMKHFVDQYEYAKLCCVSNDYPVSILVHRRLAFTDVIMMGVNFNWQDRERNSLNFRLDAIVDTAISSIRMTCLLLFLCAWRKPSRINNFLILPGQFSATSAARRQTQHWPPPSCSRCPS